MKIEIKDYFRAGEILTEQKLNTIFNTIQAAINESDDEVNELINQLNALHLASRWIAQVDSFSDINTYIEAHKNDAQYQPPNNPLPTSGDVFLVSNNSDDPNLPVDINAGKYLYIYSSDKYGNNGKWNIYNPFALVNASSNNDGLMSKEMFNKLNSLPTGQELDFKLDNVNNELETQQHLIAQNKITSLTNKAAIENLKPRVDKLELNKQDKTTNLDNYKTKTVEDNLVEVKTIVDDLANTNLVIWESESVIGDTLTITSNSNQRIEFLITTKENAFANVVGYIKIYATLLDTNNSQVIVNEALLLGNTGVFAPSISHLLINDNEVDLAVGLQVVSPTQAHITLRFSKPLNTILTNDISIKFNKIVKDIGVSDYVWSEKLENNIKDFLTNNLGIKYQLVYSHPQPSGLNGFLEQETFELNNKYIPNSNSVEIFVGGTKLTKNVDWEEVSINGELYSNRVKFLRQVDIDKEGYVEIKAIAVIVNNYSILVWNNKDTYKQGDLVLHNRHLYYAKQENINQEPSDNSAYWEVFDASFNVEQVVQQIKDYINQFTNSANQKIDDKLNEIHQENQDWLNALPQVKYISEANGEILQFNSTSDYETYKTTMGVDDSYFQDINDDIVYRNQINTFTTNQYFHGDITINNNHSLILNGGEIFLNGGTINNVPDPIVDGHPVNLKYFNDNINEVNEHLNRVDNGLVSINSRLDGLQGSIDGYPLRTVYNSSISKIYNNNGGVFYTIFTNKHINSWETYQIKTKGDIGNPNGPQWFSSVQISSYLNSLGNVVICINKLYDSNNDLEYWKDNIMIYVWKMRF